MHRRGFLRRGGATIAAGTVFGVAGCSSSCPDSDRPTPAETVSISAAPDGADAVIPGGEWPTAHGTAGRTGLATGSLPSSGLRVRWRERLSLPPTDAGGLSASAPVVGNNGVLVADSQRVHAVDLAAGEPRWRSDRIDPTSHDTLFASAANTVAPTVGGTGTVYVGGADGLVALDGTDGTERWRVEGLRGVASPAATDQGVVALGARTVVAAGPDGEERWRRSVLRGDPPVPPAADGSTVVVPVDGGLEAFDIATGEPRWSLDRSVETYPVLVDGTCYVGNSAGLHGVDAGSGEVAWSITRGDGRTLHSPVVTEDTIYVLEQPGEAGAASFAFARTGGEPEPRWCSYLGSGAVMAATRDLALTTLSIGGGPDTNQAVAAFTRGEGQVRWAVEGGSRPRDWVTPPAVVDGALVVGTRGGTVVALGGVDA